VNGKGETQILHRMKGDGTKEVKEEVVKTHPERSRPGGATKKTLQEVAEKRSR